MKQKNSALLARLGSGDVLHFRMQEKAPKFKLVPHSILFVNFFFSLSTSIINNIFCELFHLFTSIIVVGRFVAKAMSNGAV